MTEITEFQKKRAENIIWNSAENYDFSPDLKAYDSEGQAELYWNCIIGAVRKHYDYPQIESVLRSFQQYEECDTYEGLLWLGLENCVFSRELPDRPVLSRLREEYAAAYLEQYLPESGKISDDYFLYDSLAIAHWMHVLGRETSLGKYDGKLLSELEFPPELTTEEIVDRAKKLFSRWFQIMAEEKKKRKKRHFFVIGMKKDRNGTKTKYRKFGLGIADHPENIYGGVSTEGEKERNDLATKMTVQELRAFMETKYGRPVFSGQEMHELERALCSGNHENCHLHVTDGIKESITEIRNGFEALSRQKEAAQIEKNRAYYQQNLAANRTAVARLTFNILNSVLLHLQPSPVKAAYGALNGGKVWRAVHLEDEKVFERTENDNAGDLCVDILLDASTSQKSRQETISSQGYIIAESLTKCAIPCRVMSFCSMTGFTILRIFREYNAPKDNSRIFEYVSNGCNRDGLAIRTAAHLISEAPYEHKVLIILSDVKPNDVVKIRSSGTGEFIPYECSAGVNDTAQEVRRARAEGISVICIFTGDDEDVPSARTVYNRDFVRIRSVGLLADTVGRLILEQIKNI